MPGEPAIGLVLLAAGGSRRLGRPKQLVRFGGVSLIRRTAQVALLAHCRPVVVVLGAYSEVIRPELNDLSLTIVENPEWESGMAASIRIGIKALEAEAGALNGVILMVCDQPFLTAECLSRLITAFAAPGHADAIVAAAYSDRLGTPVLFSQRYFPELERLAGQGGAKALLHRYRSFVLSVPMPEASLDVDTPDAAGRLGEGVAAIPEWPT